MGQDLHHAGGKAALWENRRALHEKDHGGRLDIGVDTFKNRVAHVLGSYSGAEVCKASA